MDLCSIGAGGTPIPRRAKPADVALLLDGETKAPVSPRPFWVDQPEFWLPADPSLALPESASGQKLADHLAHQAARHPHDLKSHARRLLLHARRKEPDAAYGALLDIFLVLGSNGRAFRERMLLLASGLIGAERAFALSERLERGVAADDLMPLCTQSRLSRSLTGSATLVTRHGGTEARERPLLDEVRDLVDSGQVHEAQRMLEDAVVEDPENQQYTQELLEIYRHTKDNQSLAAMQQRLRDKAPEAAAVWADLLTLFSFE